MIFIIVCALLTSLMVVQADAADCYDSGTLSEEGFTFTYIRDGDYVNITASVETDTWVAIGFSADELMPNTDVGVGARDEDDYFLDDRYNTARTLPPFDDSQDFTNRVVEVYDGNTTIYFTRPVSSDDEYDISLDECRYVLWAYGGSVSSYGTDGMEGVFGGHSDRGVFSDKICLCDSAITKSVSAISLMVMLGFTFYSTELF